MSPSLARAFSRLPYRIPSCRAERRDCLGPILRRTHTQESDKSLSPVSQHRSYHNVVDEESTKRYRVGGFHPVVLGDTFQNDRYKVLHKLGYGGHSTVWLARDRELERYVALKICAADYDRADHELSILQAVANLPKNDPGTKYIHSAIDSFEHKGPNGTHRCLVLEPLGPNLWKIGFDHLGMLQGNMKLVKRFTKQVLLALALLHRNKIIHADVHTGNIAIEVPSINDMSSEELVKRLGMPSPVPLQYADGLPVPSSDIHAPQFMYESADALSWEDNLEDIECAKLVDFGNAFFSNTGPSKLSIPVALRPPEVIVHDTVSEKIDIWGAGCLLFELATSEAPFDYYCNNNADVLRQIPGELGSIPERWQSAWTAVVEADWRQKEQAGETWRIESIRGEEVPDLATIFERSCEGRGMDHSQDEVTGLLRNVRKMMRTDPMERPSVVEILDDPFWDNA